MTAILLSDFFILKQDHTADSVNWLNLILWVLGVILYRFLLNVDTPSGHYGPCRRHPHGHQCFGP